MAMKNFLERNSDFIYAINAVVDAYNDAEEEVKRLNAKNAMLRELVCDMWREIASACMDQAIPRDTLREFSDRMRELRIEVEP